MRNLEIQMTLDWEQNVYIHDVCSLLLTATPSVVFFYHNVLMEVQYNGVSGKLRALYGLLLLLYEFLYNVSVLKRSMNPNDYDNLTLRYVGPKPLHIFFKDFGG